MTKEEKIKTVVNSINDLIDAKIGLHEECNKPWEKYSSFNVHNIDARIKEYTTNLENILDEVLKGD